MTRTLLVISLLALGGCTTTLEFVPPTSIAKIPQTLRQACAGVVNIPERDLTVAEVSRLWAKDRKALGTCMRRQGALAKAVTVQEAGR
jgi:hypothetical protein